MEIDNKGLSQIKMGMRIFLIITVVSITILLVITAKRETIASLKQISPWFFFIALVTCLFRIYLECLRLQTLSWSFGRWLDLRSSAEFTLGGYFLSLTPFGVGGMPLQIYILMKNKFSFGESGAIIGMRGISSLIGFAFFIPILVSEGAIFANTGIRILSHYLTIVYGILFVLFILAMIRTERVKYRLRHVSKFFARRRKERVAAGIDKLSNEIDKFKFGLKRCWNKGIYKLGLTIFISVISLFVYTLIAPLVFRGLGIEAPIMRTAIIQFILTFLLMFVPTPGGAGIAEGVGFALFSNVCMNPELLGVYVILWRFFTYYVGVIIGSIVIIRMLVGRRRFLNCTG